MALYTNMGGSDQINLFSDPLSLNADKIKRKWIVVLKLFEPLN